MTAFLSALLLQSGYNATLVALGSALLGASAGVAGTFLFLRKRALVSDAVAHATLPGVAIAFMVMVALGGEGRSLPGLLLGSAVSAGVGLLTVEWIARRTRLPEDAAIGAVLSVFFGFGIVLLTVIQSMSSGRQAGLEGFLLGSTAGMLLVDAVLIVVGGLVSVGTIVLLRRPMTLVAFDADFAAASGVDVRRIDLAMMGLVMAVTVIGLKIVGLILIVALLIIPSVAARFWTDRTDRLLIAAGVIGAVSAYLGAALSASVPDVPTGPMIVLVCAGLFLASMLLAPHRGVVAAMRRRRAFQRRVHRRQGLLAMARGEPIHDPVTVRVLVGEGFMRPDGVATDEGRARAARAALDERRWGEARRMHRDEAIGRYDGLTPIGDALSPDEIALIDARLAGGGGATVAGVRG